MDGMLPARQCFKAGEQAGTQLDLRLKVGDDLIRLQCLAQVGRVGGYHGWRKHTLEQGWNPYNSDRR